MTLLELLNLANEYYDDGNLSLYYDKETGAPVAGTGDTLAEFIVKELRDTYDADADDAAQVAEARRSLTSAAEQLHAIVDSLRFVRPWQRDNDALFDVLEIVDVHVPPEDIAKWTDEQVQLVEAWAGAVHFAAADNDDVEVPPKPEFLQQYGPPPHDWDPR